jgi:signal transduction histidine kinase/CheY-like chemotaxis protein
MWMVAICVLPAWIGMGLLIVKIYNVERDRAIQNTIMTARALVLAVDSELGIARKALEVLATSSELRSADFAAFYKRASDLIRLGVLPGSNIVLTERSGQQILNTLVPFGTGLPPHANLEIVNEVFNTGKAVTTDVHWGPVAKAFGFAIIIPVFYEGSVKYVLTIGVFQQPLIDLLNRQKLPSTWVVSIFDPTGVIATRTHNPDEFAGRHGSSRLLEAMRRRNSGFIESRTLEGLSVYAAFSRSDFSNWAVAIGVPSAEIDSDLYKFLAWSCGGALILLAIGLGLAAYQSEQILRAVRALIAPAMALGRGEAPTIPRLHVQELDEVAQAFARSIRVRTFERDEAERERKVAENATRLKDEFIATVSHELRTPLTSITASLGLLNGTSTGDPSEPTNRLISIALSNCQRLVRLVNDILDVEKLEAGKVVFNLQRVNIELLLGRAIEASRPVAESAGVSFQVEGAFPCEVCADPDRLMQVFSNLLSNAIKFSPRLTQITVRLEDRGDNVRVSISDHGPGVPEQFKGRIFQKFAQADGSDARPKSGTGLGLSIVKEIVGRLGGEVGFADAPDGGAVFFVDLPVLRPAEGGNIGPVLVCEDDIDVAAAISERLRHDGFAVDRAPTACDAVALASAINYAAILVDLQLPDGDGISLIQILRGLAHHAATPIIAVSANPGRGRNDLRSGNLNVFDWIGKPFDHAKLLAKIHQAIDLHKNRVIRILHMDGDPGRSGRCGAGPSKRGGGSFGENNSVRSGLP